MISTFKYNKSIHYFTIAALCLGVAVRLAVYFQQRSVFLDEANLIQNLIERPYLGLFQNLNYQQYSPPLFSVITKFIISNFGNNELTIRLFPLLCGVATLFLFYAFAKKYLAPLPLFFAVSFMAFDKVFIDYSTECKQYASDAFVSVGLLYLSQIIDYQYFNLKKISIWAFVGAFAIWLSMPAVFVLVGVGFYYVYSFYKNKDFKNIGFYALAILFWMINFGIYFILILKKDATSNALREYHNDYFFAFPPTNTIQIKLLSQQIIGIIDHSIGKTAVAIAITLVAWFFGLITLFKTQKSIFLLITLPVFASLAASACSLYAIPARLMLFFLPLLIFISCIGFQKIMTFKIPFWIITPLLFIVLAVQQNLNYLYEPFHNDNAEIRNGLQYIEQNAQLNDLVFLHHIVAPIGNYYLNNYDKPLKIKNIHFAKYVCCYGEQIQLDIKQKQTEGYKRIWIVNDTKDETLIKFAESQGKILDRFDFQRGYVLLYER